MSRIVGLSSAALCGGSVVLSLFGGGAIDRLAVGAPERLGDCEGLLVISLSPVGSHVGVRRGGGETLCADVADAVAVGVRGTKADGVMGCVADGGGVCEGDGEAPVRGIDDVRIIAFVAVSSGNGDAVRIIVRDVEAIRVAVLEAERVAAADDEPPVISADTEAERSRVPLDSEMVEVTACDDVPDIASDLVANCEAVCVSVAYVPDTAKDLVAVAESDVVCLSSAVPVEDGVMATAAVAEAPCEADVVAVRMWRDCVAGGGRLCVAVHTSSGSAKKVVSTARGSVSLSRRVSP